MKTMTIDQVIEYLNNDESDFDFAFRGDDFIPAKKFRASRYHGDDRASFKLRGVSAICIPTYSEDHIWRAMLTAGKYGDNVFLLRGRQENADAEYNDPNEVIIRDHEIVCRIVD
jgi:hypothetical protein